MEEGAANFVARRPAPPLRPYVDRYVGYRVARAVPGVHRGLPSRHLTLIVSIGRPIEVLAHTDRRQPPASYRFVLGGLQASPALVSAPGREEGVAFELTPLGCRGLLGVPAGALWDLSVEAAEVMGGAAAELAERLAGAGGWVARFAVCDDVLGRLATDRCRREPAAELRRAWQLLVSSGGNVPVAEVAADVGWGRRHLHKRFCAEMGLSPKLAGRVVRFDRARRMLEQPGRPGLAEVAATCGYYDQPHLNRDFLDLAGCPPGALLDEEVPSVQDGDASVRAGSTA